MREKRVEWQRESVGQLGHAAISKTELSTVSRYKLSCRADLPEALVVCLEIVKKAPGAVPCELIFSVRAFMLRG
jgi:hypothetical protein